MIVCQRQATTRLFISLPEKIRRLMNSGKMPYTCFEKQPIIFKVVYPVYSSIIQATRIYNLRILWLYRQCYLITFYSQKIQLIRSTKIDILNLNKFSSSQFVFISVPSGVNSLAFVALHKSRQRAEIFCMICFTNIINFDVK